MTRKEIYQQIEKNGLVNTANACARKKWHSFANYTNLTNNELLSILDTDKSKDKSTKPTTTAQKFIDEGARKAIKAIASVLGMKNIEKNF